MARGLTGMGGGAGSGTGGGARRVGPAISAGASLGQFVSRVRVAGLATALEEIGLTDLAGKTASEVLVAIVDRLSGPGSTIDESLARTALNKLRQEIFAETQTFDDVEQRLNQILEVTQVTGLVMQYFGHYLYERFVRDFFERLSASVGLTKAHEALSAIRRVIFASLRNKVGHQDPETFDWGGDAGRALADQILTTTLEIFEIE